MTDGEKEARPGPRHGERALADREARRAREAAALRENLRRRKEQTRARRDSIPLAPDAGDESPPLASPERPEKG